MPSSSQAGNYDLINHEKAGSGTLVLSSQIRVFIHHPPLAIYLETKSSLLYNYIN